MPTCGRLSMTLDKYKYDPHQYFCHAFPVIDVRLKNSIIKYCLYLTRLYQPSLVRGRAILGHKHTLNNLIDTTFGHAQSGIGQLFINCIVGADAWYCSPAGSLHEHEHAC
jgi:hypothetical protein